jgi:hypothetical protein
MYVCMYVYVYVHVCMKIYIYIYIYICLYVYTYVCTNIYIYTYILTSIDMYMYMDVCLKIYTCIWMYVYIYVCTHAHTHTLTHKHRCTMCARVRAHLSADVAKPCADVAGKRGLSGTLGAPGYSRGTLIAVAYPSTALLQPSALGQCDARTVVVVVVVVVVAERRRRVVAACGARRRRVGAACGARRRRVEALRRRRRERRVRSPAHAGRCHEGYSGVLKRVLWHGSCMVHGARTLRSTLWGSLRGTL